MTLFILVACDDGKVSFREEIKPLLNEKCLGCHGGVKKAGDLSLLSREEALAPNSRSGKRAIVPGNPAKSEMYRLISSEDEDERMPKEGHALTSEESQLIRKWIRQGAEWEMHWAYLPFKEITVPDLEDPWIRSDIDVFVKQKLDEIGLEPNEEASRERLLRRVSLDLTGLPPDERLIEEFIEEESITYQEVVKRLLLDERYGEHWAGFWLDLARYADSKGYEKDPHRNIWRYRDWVIDAFNEDMAFDRFTIYQLAGDLLTPQREPNLIATAFHRNSMTNTEGGTDDEEFRVAAVMDRVNTTFEVWQSTTMACAQCHDHPYDPITQEDYFMSAGIFNQTIDADLAAEFPVLEIYAEKEKEEIESILAFIETLKDEPVHSVEGVTNRRIEAALLPVLHPSDCDDFVNTLIYGNGIISNWSNNVNDGADRQFFFLFEDVSLKALTGIEFTYSSAGNDAAVRVTLDSIAGMEYARGSFDGTYSTSGQEWIGENEWKNVTFAVNDIDKKIGDLVFELVNTSGEIPEGIVLIKQIKLIYEGWKEDPKMDEARDQLLKLRMNADRTPILLAKKDIFTRENHVFERGSYLSPGEKVPPGIPAVFNVDDIDVGNRLKFAQWLVDDKNALTARAVVNRLWERIFGIGLIETLEEMGSQGEPSIHPELLEYLAYSFVHTNKWHIKSFLRDLVLSSTYRQSSAVNAEKLDIDPKNRYLSRGPRFRLSAEQIRDQALFVSELLFDSIGGPSVMPYQPEGIWRSVYNNSTWKESKGSMKFRRGLYTYWKRSAPYPSMEIFDAPARQVCRSRRIRTNTPSQAMVTLNDPVYIEAANALGSWMEEQAYEADDRIRRGFKRALVREPEAEELQVLVALYEDVLSGMEYEDRKDDVASFLRSPSAVVAHAIMNLDEFLTKS
jgi:hypothetical protein